MATKAPAIAAAASILTRLCLIDSTVTPPIGLRRSPDRDVLPLNVMDAYASLRPTLKNTEIRPRRN